MIVLLNSSWTSRESVHNSSDSYFEVYIGTTISQVIVQWDQSAWGSYKELSGAPDSHGGHKTAQTAETRKY